MCEQFFICLSALLQHAFVALKAPMLEIEKEPSESQFGDDSSQILSEQLRSDGVDLTFLVEVLSGVCKKIVAHPVREQRHISKVDGVLVGLLNVSALLLGSLSGSELDPADISEDIVRYVFSECLFSIPDRHRHDLLCLPKCKSASSREAALNMLLTLAKSSKKLFDRIFWMLSRLTSMHPNRDLGWNYRPLDLDRSSSGYVGLRNLGATCYMNSLLQQLFMIPEFRRCILSAAVPDVVPNIGSDEDQPARQMLSALQTCYGFLQV